jgi:hypothetical protein
MHWADQAALAREIVVEKLRAAIIAARRRKRRAAIANAIIKLELAASREGRALPSGMVGPSSRVA